MILLSHYGVAFNCLKNGYSGKQRTAGEFYADPEAVKHICNRLQEDFICNRLQEDLAEVEIVSDYLPNDFTVFVKVRK